MTAPAMPAHPAMRLYAPPVEGQPALRVLVVAAAISSEWLVRFIELARADIGIDLQIVVTSPSGNPRLARALPLDFRVALMLEKLRRRGRQGPLSRVDLRKVLALTGVPVDSGDLAQRVAAMSPDLLLAVLPDDAVSALTAGARLGTWQIDSELEDEYRAGLDFLAPMLDGDIVTRAQLCATAGDGTSTRLADTDGATQSGSLGLQRDRAFGKLPALLLRALRRVASGEIGLESGTVERLTFGPGKSIKLAPGVGVRAFLISLNNTLGWRKRLRNGADDWFVAVRSASGLIDPSNPVVGDVACLRAPEGFYWADPCLVEAGGRRLVFVEEFIKEQNRGLIACIELLAHGARRLGIVLEKPFHLSYPQVFEFDGVWYMTVESGTARRASLYRAAGFPLVWELHCELLEGCLCVDPTLHRKDDTWYLFANVSDGGAGTSEELFLFSAPTLAGPFLPHPQNPVVKDARRSRPAGRLFEYEGKLIRPAQDCAPEYGSAVIFNEVVTMTPSTYSGRPLARLGNTWLPGLWGCHTYTAAGRVDVVDACGVPPSTATMISVVNRPAIREIKTVRPIVSALMPVYNAERFLAQAIESVLDQTLVGVEVVVVNDGSTDGSAAIADRYAALHPDRVRVVHQENQGLPFARNNAIAAARGRYFALLDADDVWLPIHAEACVDVLERDPSVGLVHANAEDIDENGRVFGHCAGGRWSPRATSDAFKEVLLRRQHVTCPTAVFRRSVVEQVGAFDGRFNRLGCEDRDQWLRIALVTKLHYLDELHAQYRVHGNNMSANSERMWKARRVLVDKFAGYPRGRALERRALAAIDAERGHELAVAPAAIPALRSFMQALRRDPLRIDAWKGLVRRIVVGRRPSAVVRP